MTWILCLCQALHLLEREGGRKPQNPGSLLEDNTWAVLLFLRTALQLTQGWAFIWAAPDRVYCIARHPSAELTQPDPPCCPLPPAAGGLHPGGRHGGTKLPSLHSHVTYHCLFPASGLPGVNILAARVGSYFNQRFPPKSFRIVTLSSLHLFLCPVWWESLVKQVCLTQP